MCLPQTRISIPFSLDLGKYLNVSEDTVFKCQWLYSNYGNIATFPVPGFQCMLQVQSSFYFLSVAPQFLVCVNHHLPLQLDLLLANSPSRLNKPNEPLLKTTELQRKNRKNILFICSAVHVNSLVQKTTPVFQHVFPKSVANRLLTILVQCI